MIEIRPGTEADVDAIVAMVRACIAAMLRAGIDQWDEVYPDRATWLADARERTLSVVAADDAVVGAFVLNEFQNVEYAEVPWTILLEPVAVLHRLLVHPAQQRRGLASMMVREAERQARERGYAALRLDAFTHNPTALRLYGRHGYHDAGAVTLRKGVFRCFEKAIGRRE
jgi:ribosomal protein S18 acetylase RimI-like enzyme